MKEELDKGGYIIYAADGSPSIKCYIGSGSTVPSGQARCYEFKYSKLFGDSAPLHLVKTEDGVETENLLEKGKKIALEDFQMVKVIGRGSFGKVYLVRHKE